MVYQCISKCSELDKENALHCCFTLEYIKSVRENNDEVCPCGNYAKLKEVVKE